MAYDGDWLRWAWKKRTDAERIAAFERAQVARALAAARAAAEAAAAQQQPQQQQQQQQQSPVQIQASVTINGKSVPLPSNLLQFLSPQLLAQTQQQQQQQGQQQPASPHDAAAAAAAAGAHTGGSSADDDHDDAPASISLGDFTIETDPGAYFITHVPTGSTLTVRNLASDIVEIVNEHPESPPPPPGSTGAGASDGAPVPPQHVQLLTLDAEDYIHTLSVRVEVPGVCQGVLPAAGALFGTVPPAADRSARRLRAGSIPAPTVFLDASARSDPSFNPQAALLRMGQARRSETGQIRAHIVAAHPSLLCEPIAPGSPEQRRVYGNLVLVERGGCNFLEKALHLQSAGAIGMVVWNRADPNFLFLMGEDGSGRDVPFTSAMIGEADGAFLSACMAAQPAARPLAVTIRRDSYQPGDRVPVPPLPVTGGGQKKAAGAAQTTQSQETQGDMHVQLSGTIDHFIFKTMGGWSAQIDYDEKQQGFQLQLHLP